MNNAHALVTGGGGDIGSAVAMALSDAGAQVCLVGRTAETLQHTRRRMAATSWVRPTDITDLEDVDQLVGEVEERFRNRLDVLVHCAGMYGVGHSDQAALEEFDRLCDINARAPLRLTQQLLSMLQNGMGHVVFLNSTQSLEVRASTGLYAATQHARKAIADGIRLDMNGAGVRVLGIYVGRTAGALQEKIFHDEGRAYQPDLLLQPSDIASALVSCLALPANAEVTSLMIRPAIKSY